MSTNSKDSKRKAEIKTSPANRSKSSTSKETTATGVIKAPGAGKKEKDSDSTSNGRQRQQQGATATNEKNKTTEKGILKKPTGSKGARKKTETKEATKTVAKTKIQKKSFLEKMAKYLGFYVGNIILTDPWSIEAAQALDLRQWHLKRLKRAFDKIDLDGSGNIDYDEFFEAVGEVRSPFTDKLFSLIDLDGSGTIEFDEYVRVMATYCMFTKDEILRFCFECFDVDKSGTIDEKEFIELCKCINNAAPAFPNNFKRALEEFDVNEDGLIDYSEFLQIDSRYPLVLFPAFRLQDTMQRNSLGEGAWVKVIEKYQASKALEEYKANHGGRLPPDPPLVMLGKAFFPCFFRERVHIKVGLDMEQRHRDDA